MVQEERKILGPEELGYTDLLDYEITEKLKREDAAKKRGEGRSHPLRPSSAGFCARRLAYELMEYRGHKFYDKELLEPPVYRLFELGKAIENNTIYNFKLVQGFQQKFKQQILTFFDLPRATSDLPKEICEGSCDLVLWSEKYKAITDIKSKKDGFSYAFKTRWDEDIDSFKNMHSLIQISPTAFYADSLDELIEELNEDFFNDNLYQLNLYAMSEFLKSRGVDHAFIYRYNKNDSRHLEIRFRPSATAFDYVKDKFEKVNIAVDNKRPEDVEQEYFLGSIRCAFCPFKKQCWDEDALKAWFSKLPKKAWPKKLDNSKEHVEIMNLFTEYTALSNSTKKLEQVEREICEKLFKQKVNKIKLKDGEVYEVKHLKSPKPHMELRRSK